MNKKFPAMCFWIESLALIAIGLFFRFAWGNWSQGANLHPDEYGLTNTLTQLKLPENTSEYFNTRISPLSPYPRYDEAGSLIMDGPDNAMRWGQWPIILIRFAAEAVGRTDYDSLRLTGRFLSALTDAMSLLFIFLIGRSLYNRYVGLIASVLSSLTVLQIQQSHFMTVDNFAMLFALITIYACTKVTQYPCRIREAEGPNQNKPLRINWVSFIWYLVFGMAFGMALASRINLLPLGGIIVVAGFIGIADLRLRSKQDLHAIFSTWAFFLAVAVVVAILTFRLTQPMSFRQPVGDTTFFSINLNSDWIRNVNTAQQESSGIGGGPPGEQWAHRPAIIFPWINMVLWGMGLPLGIMGWIGFFWAAYRVLRFGHDWRAHLIPLIWTGGFFVFMGTRWVKSMRYFLPIYPFLALFASWALVMLWQKYSQNKIAGDGAKKNQFRLINPSFGLPLFATMIVVLGTLLWTLIFVRGVYLTDHTRVRATRWIYENVPGPFHLEIIDQNGGLRNQPVPVSNEIMISGENIFVQSFTSRVGGQLSEIVIPHVDTQYEPARLRVAISTDNEGKELIDETIIQINPEEMIRQNAVRGTFHNGDIQAGKSYYLIAGVLDQTPLAISRSAIANESWDEGLPFPFNGYDPFGQLYRGLTMEVRWYDDENKREMFINTLEEADYIILSSQRALWSTCRLPRTYPMTMDYYSGLFDGKLGFDLAATFTAPFQSGPFQISDLAGEIGINQSPALPIFNHNLLAAEEAFSVYDHPPVWIFKKSHDFNYEAVKRYFDSIDLSQAVVQSPRDASFPPCQ